MCTLHTVPPTTDYIRAKHVITYGQFALYPAENSGFKGKIVRISRNMRDSVRFARYLMLGIIVMDKSVKFPSWLAPIIGAILPIGMAMVGQYKEDRTILAIWEIESEKLLLMVGLGFLGGLIVWGYDLMKTKFNKKQSHD